LQRLTSCKIECPVDAYSADLPLQGKPRPDRICTTSPHMNDHADGIDIRVGPGQRRRWVAQPARAVVDVKVAPWNVLAAPVAHTRLEVVTPASSLTDGERTASHLHVVRPVHTGPIGAS
jgi:hypothetical protein